MGVRATSEKGRVGQDWASIPYDLFSQRNLAGPAVAEARASSQQSSATPEREL